MVVDIAPLPARFRPRFPIFERQVYVNSCSQGALSESVRAAYGRYLDDWDERGAPWEYWVEQAEAARAGFARLLSATPDEVAVTTSVSAGVSALVSALPLDGDRRTIVVSDLEFPTIGQIAHAQELRGATVVHVPPEPDGTVPLERFAEAIDERTALVCVTSVSYRTGSRLDVAGVARLAHERGALVLADAYQAAGAIPLDVRALDVDLLAGGTVKYLLGSSGLGFLYCRSDLHTRLLPTQTGWFADEDIFTMDIWDYSPSPTARRFEAGTPPVPNIYAGLAGLELIEEAGVEAIELHVRGLNTRLIEGVEELGGRVVTPRPERDRGPLVCIAATDEHALVAALAAEGVAASSRDGSLRISPHLYNTEGDIDAVLDGLRRHQHLLAS